MSLEVYNGTTVLYRFYCYVLHGHRYLDKLYKDGKTTYYRCSKCQCMWYKEED